MHGEPRAAASEESKVHTGSPRLALWG